MAIFHYCELLRVHIQELLGRLTAMQNYSPLAFLKSMLDFKGLFNNPDRCIEPVQL